MAWGGSAGADVVDGRRATTPVTAVDVDADQAAFEVAPAEVAISVATAVCENEPLVSAVNRVAPLGAEGLAFDVVLPSPSTSRSPASVVVTLGGVSPAIAPAASMGLVVLIPLNASVTMATSVDQANFASATGVELPTAYVHATSWELEPFVPLNAFVQPVGQVTELLKLKPK